MLGTIPIRLIKYALLEIVSKKLHHFFTDVFLVRCLKFNSNKYITLTAYLHLLF